MLIVGAADGTTVKIASPTISPSMVTLNAGEFQQWVGGDPTGAVLQSLAPIGVFTGLTYRYNAHLRSIGCMAGPITPAGCPLEMPVSTK